MTETENNMSFEEAISKLELLVKELENGTCSLDDAINKYTEGMKLAKYCGEKLNSATEKVNKILTEAGELKDFDVNEAENQ